MECVFHIDLSINEPWGEKWNCVCQLSSSSSLASWLEAAAGLMNLEVRCEAVCVRHTDKPQLVFFGGTWRRPHLWSFSDLFSTDNRHCFKVDLHCKSNHGLQFLKSCKWCCFLVFLALDPKLCNALHNVQFVKYIFPRNRTTSNLS